MYLSIFSRSPEEANFRLKYWNWDETTETQISFTCPTIALDEDSLLKEEAKFYFTLLQEIITKLFICQLALYMVVYILEYPPNIVNVRFFNNLC